MGDKETSGKDTKWTDILKALGGLAAIFMALGYVVVLSFENAMDIYGIVEFPLQFYKDASVSFFSDIFSFYLRFPYMLFPVAAIIFAPRLSRYFWPVDGQSKKAGYVRSIIEIVAILAALVATSMLDNIESTWSFWDLSLRKAVPVFSREVIYYAVSIPALIALCLLMRYKLKETRTDEEKESLKVFLKEPLKEPLPFVFLILTVFLVGAVPIVYGATIYDVQLYLVEDIKVSKELDSFDAFNSDARLYMLGHSSGREMFFDFTVTPASAVLVDKKFVESLVLSGDQEQISSLRKLKHPPDDPEEIYIKALTGTEGTGEKIKAMSVIEGQMESVKDEEWSEEWNQYLK